MIALDVEVGFDEAFVPMEIIGRAKPRELEKFADKMRLIEVSEINGKVRPIDRGMVLDESPGSLKPLNPAVQFRPYAHFRICNCLPLSATAGGYIVLFTPYSVAIRRGVSISDDGSLKTVEAERSTLPGRRAALVESREQRPAAPVQHLVRRGLHLERKLFIPFCAHCPPSLTSAWCVLLR
jgi:hypothetical protein